MNNDKRKRAITPRAAVLLLVLLAGCAPAEGPVYDLVPGIGQGEAAGTEIRLRVDYTAGTVIVITTHPTGDRVTRTWTPCKLVNSQNWECEEWGSGPNGRVWQTLEMSPGFVLVFTYLSDVYNYERRSTAERGRRLFERLQEVTR